jgi:hypothetical protein
MKRISFAVMLAFLPAFAHAIDLDDNGTFTLTGFYNIVGGDVLSGGSPVTTSPYTFVQPFASPSRSTWRCPCTIQNWEYVGVYQEGKGLELNQESLAGVQFKKEFTPTFSGTIQLVSRATNSNAGSTPTVDWAYLTWTPATDSPWTFQVGKFRIPLYYYSDYLYIGYAYQWVRPIPDVYGWPIYSYDGANVGYRHQIPNSDWSLTSQAWWGSYTQHDDAYDTEIYYGVPTNESWKNIWGTYGSLSNGVVDVRAMLMKYRDDTWQSNPAGGPPITLTGSASEFTRIEGLAANVDYKNIVIRSEIDRYQQIDLPNGVNNVYKYMLLGVGYNIGNVTPMYTFSRYRTIVEPIEGRNTQNISVRWDFMKNTALKVQYDVSRDESHYPTPFFGDSKLLSIAIEGVF